MKNRFLSVVGLLLLACIAEGQSFSEFIINPDIAGSFPTGLTVFNSKLYFSATDSAHGYEPWVTDGTNAQLTKDIFVGTGSSFPQNFTVDSNLLFFQANDSVHGAELWAILKGVDTPYLVKDIYQGQNPSLPQNLFAFNDKLYFQADDGVHGPGLWVSDGTAGGTQLVNNINQANGDSAGSFPSGFTAYNGKLYFNATDSIHGYELWSTDGTANGTTLVSDIWPGTNGSNPTGITVYNGKLYFSATDSVHGTELWVSDGTAGGTQIVMDINPGYQSSFPQNLIAYNSLLIFQADDGVHGPELWSTDGTTGVTKLVADIWPGLTGSYPQGFILYKNKLFFQATDSLHGSELWTTDGTNSGTVLFDDIVPGPFSSSPAGFTVYHNNLYFIAQPDTVNGNQMLITNGTLAGTGAIIPGNINVNPLGSTYGFTLFNNSLAFNAFYDGWGEQLWFFNDAPVGIVEAGKTSSFTLYPNPSTDHYTVSGFQTGETYNLTLTDMTGRILQVQEIQASGPAVQFVMPRIAAGTYLIEVQNEHEISTLRMVKND